MENNPSGTASKDSSQSQPHQPTNMTMLVMPQQQHDARGDFQRWGTWNDVRSPAHNLQSRPRSDQTSLMLPPISSIFQSLGDGSARTPSSAISPTGPAPSVASPQYVHSPNSNKRRRSSVEDEMEEERSSRVPRRYVSSPRAADRAMPRPASPGFAPRVSPEQWALGARTSPPMPHGGLPAIRSSVAAPPVEQRVESRPPLPSYQHQHQHPSMPFRGNGPTAPAPMPPMRGPPSHEYPQEAARPPMRGPASDEYAHEGPRSMMRGPPNDEYLQEPPRPMYAHSSDMRYEPPSYRRAPTQFSYGYHHPSRPQSLSMGAIHHHVERMPFSPMGYGPPYGDYVRFGEMGMGGDSKQRKRRGNLPKETTDKLRTWFHDHLSHPYPTEDEKQELMRQTGLQMSKNLVPRLVFKPSSSLLTCLLQTKSPTGSSMPVGDSSQP